MSCWRHTAWQHGLGSAASVAWGGLIAYTFADQPQRWLTSTLVAVFTLLLSLNLALAIFLWRRTELHARAAVVPAIWLFLAALASDLGLGYLYAHPQGLPSLQPPDPLLGWAMKPGVKDVPVAMGARHEKVSTDSMGFRNRLPYPSDGRIACAVQGDSHIFGFGLAFEDTLCEQLNRLMGSGYFYNFGVCGYDINHFYFQYERLARHIKPAMRLIVFNTGNDFSAAALITPYYYPRAYLMVSNGEVLEQRHNAPPLAIQAYGQHFIPPYRAYDSLIAEPQHEGAERYPLLIRRPLGRFLVENIHPTLCRLWESVQKRLAKQNERVDVHYPRWMLLKPELWPEPFRSYSRDFPAILAKIKAQHPRLAICLIPMRSQVIYAKRMEVIAWLKKRGRQAEDIDVNAFAAYLAPICEQLDIALIDPLPNFISHPTPETLYQPADQHLSAKGQALLAEVITQALHQRFAECFPHAE